MSPAALRQLRVQLAGKRQVALVRSRQRLMIGLLLFVALVGLLTLRLLDLGLLHDGSQRGRINILANLTPPRADIVDRNGVQLAGTLMAYGVAVRPHDVVGDKRILAQQIAAILGRDPADIYRQLNHKGKFRYLQRRVLPTEAKAINALGEPGILLEREPDRLYPNQKLAAHVLGHTNIDGLGEAGIERAFDQRLVDPAQRGQPLMLAIDARVQQAIEHELGVAMAKHSAIGGAGIVMDVHTGEVLALTSLPELDPNAAGRGTLEAQFNRATLGVYELGSTFKAFTTAMALDTGVVRSMRDGYDARHPIKVGRFRINDDHPKARWLSIPEIFIYSSNIGTAKMAQEVGMARQRDYMQKLGFLEPVHIELKERGRTLYPASNNWGEIATMTVGYGHGIAVTPLHLATAYAALVNGGLWRPATLLRIPEGKVPSGRRVFSAEASRQMNDLMRLVVTHGTGKRADAPGFRVGGKTGTAEKPQAGGYNRKALVTTFAAAFPMDDPKYVVIAMLDEPKGTKDTYGFASAAWTVGPVISRVVSRIGPLLGVTPDLRAEANIGPLLAHVREAADKNAE